METASTDVRPEREAESTRTLPVASSAVVTQNVRDFVDTQLRFPDIRILHPRDLIKEIAP